MMAILENSLEVKEAQSVTPRLLLIGIFCVVHLVSALLGPINLLNGELLDTDSYTRLNRVLFVYEQGDWNNSIYPRSNAPFGESIHWTKPMDFILLAGAGVFSMFVPFSKGLHAWGVLISPLLHIVAFAGLFCLMRKREDRLSVILLVILFLLQPILTSYFMIGRPDHHSLILAIFSWFLVGLHWGLQNPRNLRHLIFIGCTGALGLWVSVEFLVPIGFFLSAYTLVWIWQGKAKIYPILVTITSMLIFSSLFLCLERLGEDLLLIEYDRISLPHETVLGLVLVVWFGISLLSRKTTWLSTIGGRIVTIGIGSILACVVQWHLFPGFFQGPLAEMDPAIRELLWGKASETQPLQLSEAIMSLGIVILALPYLAHCMRQGIRISSKYQGLILFVGACIFIPLSLYESRWTPYASIILLIPYVEGVRRALGWIEKRWPQRRGEAASLMFGLLLLFWPITVGTVVALEQPKRESSIIGGNCPLLPLGRYLTALTQNDPAPKTILAFKDFGPELLYRTPHRIVGTPMHRNPEGLGDSLAIMKAENPWNAQFIIQRRQIDLILICLHSKVEAEFYLDSSSNSTDNFYTMLVEGMYPPWLNEVVLPENLQESFRLFEVVKSRMSQDS